jgi:hypothetical protein
LSRYIECNPELKFFLRKMYLTKGQACGEWRKSYSPTFKGILPILYGYAHGTTEGLMDARFDRL